MSSWASHLTSPSFKFLTYKMGWWTWALHTPQDYSNSQIRYDIWVTPWSRSCAPPTLLYSHLSKHSTVYSINVGWINKNRVNKSILWGQKLLTFIFNSISKGYPRTYCIAQGTLLNVMWQLDGKGVWKRMDTCICMAESLCCPPETITTSLIGYTPI